MFKITIIFVVALLLSAVFGNPEVLESVYPDVRSCFKEVKPKSVYLASEWYQSKLEVCLYDVKERNDLCLKACLLEAENIMARKPFQALRNLKKDKDIDELTYKRLLHDQQIGMNYTVQPFISAYHALQTYLGIVPSDTEKAANPNIKKNIELIEKRMEECRSLSFFIPKTEPSNCEALSPENTLKLEKLKDCLEAAMCLYDSTDAAWAKGRIYIDMVNCYKDMPRKFQAETSEEITKNQKRCLKLNSDPQSLCYKLCILWWAKLVGKDIKAGNVVYKVNYDNAWSHAGDLLMGISKEELNSKKNKNEEFVGTKLEKCNKDFGFETTKEMDSKCNEMCPKTKTQLGQLIDCVEQAFVSSLF
ncbi:unnamed protein product [Orchesella dallaii]|uniref:Uncharacterized protein n=1 Tax=Orchesella dallaii TaxID=48710 RepID=A0ABP1RZY7_9HEXA